MNPSDGLEAFEIAFAIVFSVLVFLIIPVALAFVARRTRGQWLGAFLDLDPQVVGGSWGQELSFRYRGVQGRVFSQSAEESSVEPSGSLAQMPTLCLHLQLPAPVPGRVTVMRDIFQRGFQARNATDVKLGDEPFDALFLIEEDRSGLAATVLPAPVREALRDLQRAAGALHLSVGGHSLILKMHQDRPVPVPALARRVVVGVTDALAEWIGVGGSADGPQVEAAPSLGGPVLTSDQELRARLAAGGSCLICGSALAEAPQVRCRTCGTPHHRECFEYLGRCAVFACPSRHASP